MTPRTWITLYPDWYVKERRELARSYPGFTAYEPGLSDGQLYLFGELRIRPSTGTRVIPVSLLYPQGFPFEKPIVTPLTKSPELTEDGELKEWPSARFLNRRHQMKDGSLCLFQRDTRGIPGGDIIGGVDTLHRAERWFVGQETGHMPPDSADAEIEEHFAYAGEVLLGEVFFEEELQGRGRFYMVPDLRRIYHGDTTPVLIMTGLTEETSVVRTVEAREDLSHLYPWIKDKLWDPIALADENPSRGSNTPLFDKGNWWSLSAEPEPFHLGAGFLESFQRAMPAGQDPWETLKQSLGTDLSTVERLFIGLKYPGRSGSPEWLIVCLDQSLPKGGGRLAIRSDAQKLATFRSAKAACLRTRSLRPSVLQLRNTGVVRAELSEKTIAMIGLGALGGKVAELLAQAGVGRFLLCDLDRLSIGNVARHIGGLTDFGMPKVHVVRKRMLEINPRLRSEADDIWFGSAVGSLDRLASFIDRADLTIATTADESVEAVLNQEAVILEKPVVYARALKRGAVGRVFLVRPRRDACKCCLASFATGVPGVPDDWLSVREDADEAVVHECGRPVIPASAVDLNATASLTARVALDYLEGIAGDANHWLWSRASARDIDPGLREPFSTVAKQYMPRTECPACREPDVVAVVLTEEVRSEIVTHSESSPDAETCGILIGYIDSENRAVAVRATGPGPNATRSASVCRREVHYVQAELQRAAEELGQRGTYIGEWHSHLEAEPTPSPTDVGSLSGISAAANYLTRCPVMLIVGVDPADAKVKAIRSWAFPVGGRTYSIENMVHSGG